MSFNEKHSYTEHVVTTPTSDFNIGFADYGGTSDTINVLVNDIPAQDVGYTVSRKNDVTVTLEPPVPSGIVRIQRETNIDTSFHTFSAGAKFVASNVDSNFKQILHSQQEVKDSFVYTTDYVQRVLNGYSSRIDAVEYSTDQVIKDLKVEAIERKQGDLDSRRYAEDLLGMSNFWDGITARSVYDAAQGNNQAELNDLMGLPYHYREGGYKKYARVMLDNGDMVICIDPHAGTNPNTDMTGWLYESVAHTRDYPKVLGSRVLWDLDYKRGTLIYGLGDPTHLDDNLNHFRGLNNPEAYHPSNRAIGAVSFGRNNPPFSYLSLGFGHDCVPYGVASIVGGAGSATGDPDNPTDGAANGYCSLAVGKDTRAGGRISNAMGERNISASRYSSTDGYKCIAGKVLPSHPDYSIHGGEGEEGAAARAHGYESEAYGNFAFAYGSFLRAYNGAQVIGKGVSSSLRGLAMGYGVDRPTLFLEDGATRGETRFGWVGFNTNQPLSKYDWRLQQSDTLSYTIDAQGSPDTLVAFEVKGLLGNGSYGSLHNVIVTHTNAGQPYGIVQYRLNGTEYLTVDQTRKAKFSNAVEAGGEGFVVQGKRVVGGQLDAIANLPSNATLADVIAKVNKILETLRDGTGHGLISA